MGSILQAEQHRKKIKVSPVPQYKPALGSLQFLSQIPVVTKGHHSFWNLFSLSSFKYIFLPLSNAVTHRLLTTSLTFISIHFSAQD